MCPVPEGNGKYEVSISNNGQGAGLSYLDLYVYDSVCEQCGVTGIVQKVSVQYYIVLYFSWCHIFAAWQCSVY